MCCAYELMERGHDVTVLEASGRNRRACEDDTRSLARWAVCRRRRRALHQTGLRPILEVRREVQPLRVAISGARRNMLRRIDDKWFTEEQLQDREVLKGFGFNAREIDYIVQHGWTELPLLYLGPYLDGKFQDEYQPFGAGLDQFDEMTGGELLTKDGAVRARRCDSTACDAVTVARPRGTTKSRPCSACGQARPIVKRRGLPVFKREVFRLKGGNQLLTDTFARRSLGQRVRLGCPIAAIEAAVTRKSPFASRSSAKRKQLETEYLVCCIPLAILKKIPVTPAWPESKRFRPRQCCVWLSSSRVLLQSRTPFWKGELPSINLETGDSAMYLVYENRRRSPPATAAS